ncbi:hypothetical protein ABZX92_44455 [Lentzea sp. NPDC006480]|uniref:hypothetical protein n=1 Tax=Lentzea sp. NPDC006480 TaxID=3157176 RepID=UPI0033B887F3
MPIRTSGRTINKAIAATVAVVTTSSCVPGAGQFSAGGAVVILAVFATIALVAALSTRRSRRSAAFRVLELLLRAGRCRHDQGTRRDELVSRSPLGKQGPRKKIGKRKRHAGG